jgi:Tlde1 domain
VLGCAWNLHANVFGASVYPSMAGGNFDAPVIRRLQSVVARTPQAIVNNVFAALPEPAPMISAPATVASISPLEFNDRFGAAAPQGVAPTPQTETPKLALAPAPTEAPKPAAAAKLAEAPRPKESSPPPAPVQLAAIAPESRSADAKPAKSTSAVRDMAQRAKAAVISLAASEKQSIVEKLWGKPQPQPHGPSLLSFASADASVTGSLGSGSLGSAAGQNPALAGNTPRYDQSTAVYDISAHMVYLPDGSRLEAHSGLGSKLDDPRSASIRMHGVTPPHLYDLTPRESLFHGVAALRLKPVGGEDAIFGRSGLLAHTYMLGPNGDSNGCVSFRDYNAFLNAYRNQGIKRLAVVARVE